MSDFFELLLASSVLRMVLFPALCALPLAFFRPTARDGVRRYLLAVASLQVVVTWLLLAAGWRGQEGFAALRDIASDGRPLAWIPRYGIRFDLGVDGISAPLVALTSLLLPLVLLASWHSIDKHWRSYGAALLLLTSGILGALCALDLFVFYVFWELMLVPMYLVIGIWGGERRIYAAIKFFLYTMAGSLLMLLAILYLAWTYHDLAGVWSFSYENLLAVSLPSGLQLWLFGAFALSFAIKVPLFPFHTWLPDAHVEAPTAGSVILAGVLLKLGTYGLLRFALPLFPYAWHQAQPVLVTLAVIGILYGALVAWTQEDMKKLIAYSSVAHLGFVVLGLAAVDRLAFDGALLQMVNHGLSTGALFLLVGMLYERRHTKAFDQFGGLAAVMPRFAIALVFATLASVGLPGLNGFVGEFLILVGSFRSGLIWATCLATFGVVLAAIYLFKMLHRTLWGPITREENRELDDLSLREMLVLAPLCLLMLAIGLAPERFLAPSRPALEQTLISYQERLSSPPPQRPTLRLPPRELAR
jgi:NADH-quinone oxidoreductase subunit M